MITFSLPFFYEHRALNTALMLICHDHPEYFQFKNLAFTTNGTLPYFYWSSQNYNNIASATVVDRKALAELAQASMPIVLNCANPNLTIEDLLDSKNNAILGILENGSNRLLISNPVMGEYFLQGYPTYYLQGDSFYPTYDPDKKFLSNLTLIRQTKFQRDSAYYQDIPKEKIELCVGSCCANCVSYADCLQQNAISSYSFSQHSASDNCPSRRFIAESPEEIKAHIQAGYRHFYLDTIGLFPGDWPILLENYLQIFIRPEYQTIVEQHLKEAVTNAGW